MAVHIDFRVAVGEFGDDAEVVLVEVKDDLSNCKGMVSHNDYWFYLVYYKDRAKLYLSICNIDIRERL